jgi:hypothetical protein
MLIATSQPHEIHEIIARYEDDLTKINSNYMDILLISQGAITYDSLMSMPLPMIDIFVKRHNERNSES